MKAGDVPEDQLAAEAPPSVRSAHPGARLLPSQRPGGPQRPWHNQHLPTLFDRLCDDAPHELKEASAAFAPTRNQMRRIVQRDLGFLLNAANQEDLLHPHKHSAAISSTVNYGVPAVAGSYLSERQWLGIQKAIRRAILDFEPRLLPGSLLVKPLMKEDGSHLYNVLVFEISGLLHMEPYPVEFTVQTSVDLETNHVSLHDAGP